jgi:iron complex transport system substrate-binding protein
MNTKALAIIAVLILIVAGAAVAVVVMNDNGSKDAGDRTVTDIRGREVTIPNDVKKVVCVSAGALRMVSYFDIDRVVGVDSMDKGTSGSAANYNLAVYRVAYADEIKAATDVGTASSFKEIAETGADVIFTTTEGVEVLDNIQAKTGIPVIGLRAEVYFDLDSLQTFSKQLKLIGQVLKMDSRADQLINGIQALFVELENYRLSASASDLQKAYVCGLMTGMNGNFYKTTGHYLPFSYTVGLNIAPDIAQSPYIISQKDIIDQDPTYIFVDDANYASCMTTMKTDKAILGSISAIANEKVYSLLPYKYYNTNYEAELINCFAVGKIIAPGIYDYDLEKKANEIFQLFFPGTSMTLASYSAAIGHGIGYIDPSEYK